MNVFFAGLGSMGLGMAGCLVRSGHTVYGTDPNSAGVDMLRDMGGHGLDGEAPLADAVITVVLNADQTRAVLFGDGGFVDRLRPGGVVMSCATVAPAFAIEMEQRVTAKGLSYLDAPISGGAIKAAEGRLSIMASGSPAAFDLAAPLLDALAETVHRLGDTAGAGSAMKAVNQLLAGTHIAAMGEALAFGAAQGLDLSRIVEVISASAGTSWMFENRAPHVVHGDYTPRSTVDIWLKDLGIVSDIAAAAGLPMPVVTAALDQFRATSRAGMGQEDDAAITKYVADMGGVTLPKGG